ncbi:MAG: hypothetical protein IJ220_01060 [Clostridia bacterium]|nr:hypothetical protein [Clostridia bacterium]
MDIKFWNQPKDLSLGNLLNEKLRKGFQKVWLIAGVAKDTGIEMLLESIEEARNLGTEVNVLIGTDRKNISKDMLMKLLKLGCHLFLHINRDENKVETRIYIFESDDRQSLIYESSGKLSEGGLYTSQLVVQEISYMPAEKKMFENAKNIILQGTEVFKETDEEELKLLAEKGEVVARIIERKIPSISEMYGGTSIETIGNDMYDESSSGRLFDIPENDFDIDIDINIDGEIKKAELSVETEAKKQKIEKENVEKLAAEKLSKFYEELPTVESEKKVSIIKDMNNIDFSNVNIFVFELNKIVEKGLGEGAIKVPVYLFEEMKNFFGSELFDTFIDEKGKAKFGTKVAFEILDTQNNETVQDENAFIYVEDRYLALKSKVLKELRPEEKDILRMIKNSENRYCLELIRKNSKEYNIWENFCVYAMKNSKRKFGIM